MKKVKVSRNPDSYRDAKKINEKFNPAFQKKLLVLSVFARNI